MKVLITGITGMAGSHLADYLLTLDNIDIYGTKRWRSPLSNIEHIKENVKLIDCELTDSKAVEKVIDDIKPDKIFHLAAQSHVPTSWQSPTNTLTNNIVSELNIFEAVRKLGICPIIHIAGSSEEYGMVYEDEIPIKETNPLRPLSPYGVSKVTQDLLAYQYQKSYGLNVCRTRAFNHTGPRRPDVFMTSAFAKQMAEIVNGKQEPKIYVGNLESKRDFTDVRDVVKAYWLATEKCYHDEVYNICSGKCWSGAEVLDILLGIADISVDIVQDPSRMRPSDVPLLYGDCSKFQLRTGWMPEIPFETTMKDLFEYWKAR